MNGRRRAIASTDVGVDEYYSEVLPEDKAGFVAREKAAGRKVIMVGDGINDSTGSVRGRCGNCDQRRRGALRSEIADVTDRMRMILYEIVTLKAISNGLMKRIHKNYQFDDCGHQCRTDRSGCGRHRTADDFRTAA